MEWKKRKTTEGKVETEQDERKVDCGHANTNLKQRESCKEHQGSASTTTRMLDVVIIGHTPASVHPASHARLTVIPKNKSRPSMIIGRSYPMLVSQARDHQARTPKVTKGGPGLSTPPGRAKSCSLRFMQQVLEGRGKHGRVTLAEGGSHLS